jgi:hypothetical protein
MSKNDNELFVQMLEKKISAPIPPELRLILTNPEKLNLSRNRFKRFVNENFNQEIVIEGILGFKEIDQALDALEDIDEFVQSNLLPFGETLASSIICISLDKSSYGAIFVYDGDFGPTKVADSLEGFLNQLY